MVKLWTTDWNSKVQNFSKHWSLWYKHCFITNTDFKLAFFRIQMRNFNLVRQWVDSIQFVWMIRKSVYKFNRLGRQFISSEESDFRFNVNITIPPAQLLIGIMMSDLHPLISHYSILSLERTQQWIEMDTVHFILTQTLTNP